MFVGLDDDEFEDDTWLGVEVQKSFEFEKDKSRPLGD
jgi:hypothetical protein